MTMMMMIVTTINTAKDHWGFGLSFGYCCQGHLNFFFCFRTNSEFKRSKQKNKKNCEKEKKNCFHLYFFSCKTKDFHLSRIKLVKKTKQRKLLWTLFMNTSSSSSSSCMNRKQSQTMHTIERMFWNKLNFQTTVRLSANLQMDNEKNNKRMERKNGK